MDRTNISGKLSDRKTICYRIAAAIPVLYALFIVGQYSRNVMIWDEWDSILFYYNSLLKEGFSLQTLFMPHNEHEMCFPKLVFVAVMKVAHGNMRVLMFMTLGLAVGLYALYLRYITKENKYSCLFPILIGLVHFDMIQWENFLWGFQFAYYSALFFAVMAFYCFSGYCKNPNGKDFFLTNFFAVIAAYSSLQGFLCWIVLFIAQFVWYLRERKFHPLMLLSNLCIFIIQFLIYKPLYHTGAMEYVFSVRFCLAELGAPFTGVLSVLKTWPISVEFPEFYNSVDVFLGAVVFISGIVFCIILLISKNIELSEIVFPLAVIAYGYGFVIMTAMGRYDAGLSGTRSSRYMTYALLPYIGIILLLFRLPGWLDKVNLPEQILQKLSWTHCIVLLTSITCAFIVSNIIGYADVKQVKKLSDWKYEVLCTYDEQPLETLTWIYPWGTIADMYTKFDLAKELETNVFANPAVTSRFKKYIEVDFADGHRDRLSQIFFDTGNGFNEEESIRATIFSTANGNVCSKTYIREQLKVRALRIDPVSDDQLFSVRAVRIVNGDKSVILSADEIPSYFEFVNISKWDVANGVLTVSQTQNSDPIWNGTAAFLKLYHSVMGEET